MSRGSQGRWKSGSQSFWCTGVSGRVDGEFAASLTTVTQLWKHLQTSVFLNALFLAQILLKGHNFHSLSPVPLRDQFEYVGLEEIS